MDSEMRFSEFPGTCYRCSEYGHTADSSKCDWLTKAASPAEHQARIASFTSRWIARQITLYQKRDFITAENELERKAS